MQTLGNRTRSTAVNQRCHAALAFARLPRRSREVQLVKGAEPPLGDLTVTSRRFVSLHGQLKFELMAKERLCLAYDAQG
jgi:hypothetical protein